MDPTPRRARASSRFAGWSELRDDSCTLKPPTLLEYTWGKDQLRWELTERDGGTRLTLRHRAQGPEWLPKVAAGWHICLDVADRLLDGDRLGAIRGQEALEYGWTELNDAYRADLT